MHTITTIDDAREYITLLARSIGLGFHPDTRAGEYGYPDGRRVFSATDAASIDADVDRCHELLGDSIYGVALGAITSQTLNAPRGRRFTCG